MIRRSFIPVLALASLAAGCATVPPVQPPPAVQVPPTASPLAASATRVLDRDAVARLIANQGVTLQWLGWNQRGTAHARWDGAVLRLTAAQAQSGSGRGNGRLFLDGVVEEVGRDYFTFRGTIRIDDAPDPGRRCEAAKSWHFAVTQSRPYWRLREFEWCDRLTDYIDIYFQPAG